MFRRGVRSWECAFCTEGKGFKGTGYAVAVHTREEHYKDAYPQYGEVISLDIDDRLEAERA